MPHTIWTFLCLPDGTVERYPWKRYDQFYDGKSPLDRDVGAEALFVELALQTQSGHPLRMVRAWFPRYEVGPSGYVSRDHQQRRAHDAVNVISLGSGDEKVVPLAPRIAQARLTLEHSWQPSASQLDAIATVINHAAAKDLVRSDGRKLVPL
jgi:hypothetical protein